MTDAGRAACAPSGGSLTEAPLIGTNWKMTLTPSEAREYLLTLRELMRDLPWCRMFVLPSFPALAVAADVLEGSNIAWGAQDVHPLERGPHTGEVSAAMLADLGCRYVLAGHIERRRDRGESDALVGAKVAAIRRWGMTPIVCVGEASRMPVEEVLADLSRQLAAAAAQDLDDLVVAYEPGWAIGAGMAPAGRAWIRDVHSGIRDVLCDLSPAGMSVPIIYGGSVDLESARELAGTPNVDGLFIGRHALDPRSFAAIAHATSDLEGARP